MARTKAAENRRCSKAHKQGKPPKTATTGYLLLLLFLLSLLLLTRCSSCAGGRRRGTVYIPAKCTSTKPCPSEELCATNGTHSPGPAEAEAVGRRKTTARRARVSAHVHFYAAD